MTNRSPIQLLLDEELLARLTNCSHSKNIQMDDLLESIISDYFARSDREKEIKDIIDTDVKTKD